MKKEDVEFLEKVMREGIVDEGERMKSILADLTESLEAMLVDEGGTPAAKAGGEEAKRKELGEEDMLELLQELRDIVEQIDYARAFMALGGIPFLLGCATHGAAAMPASLRRGALGVLSTMCQNNPPVQLSLLEHGHLPQLLQLFLDHTPGGDGEEGGDGDDAVREKALQALSASVRGHAMAEHIFCRNERGKAALQLGLGMQASASAPRPSAPLRRRALFLLRALLLSDDAGDERHAQFADVASFVGTHVVDEAWEDDADIREMGLVLLEQLARRRGAAAAAVLRHKDRLGAAGVRRIAAIRGMAEGDEEREHAALELEAWEALLVALAEAGTAGGSGGGGDAKLIGNGTA